MTGGFLYSGTVSHRRHGNGAHAFTYPVVFAAIDVDRLATAVRSVLFGVNRGGLLSIWQRDYLKPGDQPLREKLSRLFAGEGETLPTGEIVLVTTPRLLGYVFNPVSFFLCHDEESRLVAVVAEVNNTFGERHWYLLTDGRSSPNRPGTCFRADKVFHVSPFFDRAGKYQFRFHRTSDKFVASIELVQANETVLTATLEGEPLAVSRSACVQTLVRHPLAIAMTMPRILWQAAQLYYKRKLPVFCKPPPQSHLTTLRRRPSIRERASTRIVLRFLSRMRHGRLTMTFPDGTEWSFGETATGSGVSLRVHQWSFFTKLVTQGDVGFGESYTAGDWECSDLTGLLRLMIDNQSVLDDREIKLTWPRRVLNRLLHLRRRNSETGSKQNIPAHYDLGNRLFESFLDSSMTYSCAIFEDPDQSLEAAQQNKIQAMISKAKITAEDHVLEIGCGWGAFAIEAAKQTGCRVTGVTLSHEQLKVARARAEAAGLSGRVEFLLADYRKIDGKFDKIVSIEMLEAVGHEHFETFFAICDRVLKPHGIIAVQFISMPEQRYDAYRSGCDWIQKHIFPGGHLPSLTAISAAAARRSRFVVDHLENIGAHYATTLREWRKRFLIQWKSLEGEGFDDSFRRTWEYYLCYCEAAFASNYLGTLQIVMSRMGERGASA